MALVNQFDYIIQGLNSTARLLSPNFRLKGWSCRFFGGPGLFFVVFHGWSADLALIPFLITVLLYIGFVKNMHDNIRQLTDLNSFNLVTERPCSNREF